MGKTHLQEWFAQELIWIGEIPENVAKYISQYHANLQYNICSTDVVNGYGHRITKSFLVMRPYKKCSRCGYHSLWAPDDSDSKCLWHTYEKGYDTVFSFTQECGITLKDAFSEFLSLQSGNDLMPVVPLYK